MYAALYDVGRDEQQQALGYLEPCGLARGSF